MRISAKAGFVRVNLEPAAWQRGSLWAGTVPVSSFTDLGVTLVMTVKEYSRRFSFRSTATQTSDVSENS